MRLHIVLQRLRDEIVLIKFAKSLIQVVKDTRLVFELRNLNIKWIVLIQMILLLGGSTRRHLHELVTERLNEAPFHCVLRQLLIVTLVVVDVGGGVQISYYLSLQSHVLREYVIVQSLHFPEGSLEQLEISLLLGDVLKADHLQVSESLKGLFQVHDRRLCDGIC